MASLKLAYMPQDKSNMIPQYLQDQGLRATVGTKSGLWNPAPPATPQTSNGSISSVWGSSLSVLPSSSPSAAPVPSPNMGSGNGITPAFRSHSGSTVDMHPQSLAALAADSEPVVSSDPGLSAFAPSVSSASSRLSSRQNSQTDISSPSSTQVSASAANSASGSASSGSAFAGAANSVTSSPSMGSVKSGAFSNDEIINTAIVVKNIPFAVKKEQLIEFMTQLGLPLPYAFNYHFDNGVFRGLAFANFTTADETAVVISSLNGRELGGRKLRVEYKKMLPFQERERIEREKRERRGQLEEQHQQVSQSKVHHSHSQQSSHSTAAHTQAAPADAQQSQTQQPLQPYAASRSSSVSGSPHVLNQTVALDMNDPETLQMYSSLLIFKRDFARSELCIPAAHAASLSRFQVNILKALCRRLDLNCQVAEDQTIIVSKRMDFSNLYKLETESDADLYFTGVFKNAVAIPAPNYALPRVSTSNLAPPQPNINAVNALNRWNSVGNLTSLGG